MPRNKNLTATLQPDTIPGDRLINTDELAKLLNCSKSLIARARVYGNTDLPGHIRIGGSVRYKLSTVQAFLAAKQEYHQTRQADAA